VLVLGSKLGRLLLEVHQLGYRCEGCEGKPLLFFGSEFIRKECAAVGCQKAQPFVLNTCNRFKMDDHVRMVHIPDVEVKEMPEVRFGCFAQLHGTPSCKAGFDAVVTAFAIDTSINIFRYVRTVAHVIRPGGLWTNFGPVAFETDDDEAHGHVVELSWEELRNVISHFFELQPDEKFVDSLNAQNGESMMQIEYSCIYFAAVRNDVPADSVGPVMKSAASAATS